MEKIFGMKKNYLFRDKVHGLQAMCSTHQTAWLLIRNHCLEEKLQVPLMDDIEKIRAATNIEEIAIRIKMLKNYDF